MKDSDYNELSLREIQLGELSVLRQVHKICEELNLHYYLFYGTLLGAVRHKGFIPWDDDIDIIMPRSDYNALIKYFKANNEKLRPLQLMHYSTNKDYIYPIARVSDERYTLNFNNTKEYGLGLFIDLYPLDGCGNTLDEAKRIWKKNKVKKFWVGVYGIDRYEKSTKNAFRSFLKYVSMKIVKLFNVPQMISDLDKDASKLSFDDYEYVGCTAWEVSGLGYFKKTLLDESITLGFEDGFFYAPKRYDEVLRETYGDYMQLPPENKRVPHHEYKAYKKGGDYNESFNS